MVEPIGDDETFIRHVHPTQWPPDQAKPNSGAFRDSELSVDRERLRSVEICCMLRPDHGFMRFGVADVLAIGLVVEADPLPDPAGAQGGLLPDILPPSLENNPAHAIIRGMQKSEAKKLKDRAEVIFRPGECDAQHHAAQQGGEAEPAGGGAGTA